MKTTLHFGCVVLHVQERQLSVGGESLALGSRAFDLLVALINRRETVVSTQELLDLVWPGVIVEPANVQVQVSNLRRLLGARVILTVARRGYQFGMAVAEVATPGEVDAGATDLAAMPKWLADHWRRDPRPLAAEGRSPRPRSQGAPQGDSADRQEVRRDVAARRIIRGDRPSTR